VEAHRSELPSGSAAEAGLPGSGEPHPTILKLREAADLGDAESQFRLGDAYDLGKLVERDPMWAARWYGRAAYRGHKEAQYRYARFKMAGSDNQEEVAEAYRWSTLAARQGHSEAEAIRVRLELSLGIDVLYRERAWADTFMPENAVFLSDPPTVAYLQEKLNQFGYDPGPADGSIGPQTKTALLAYQSDQGIAETGSLTAALIEKMRAKALPDSVQAASSTDEPEAKAKKRERFGLY
jgi:localization factor PodJL